MPPAEHGGADGARRQTAEELARVLALARELRDMIPPELDERLTESLHELLLALRELIDWLLERRQREAKQPAEVQDIPIQ
jgi:hypothetical protein